MRQIVFATNNPYKLKEVQNIIEHSCSGSRVKILSLEDINFRIQAPETSETLEGNAIQKARFIKNHTGYDCFADDTGLEVKALEGAPGVRSARYAGEKARYSDNNRKLLRKLKGVKNRKARFRAVIALIADGKDYLFEGKVNGFITEKPRGKGGFGYDPVFRPKHHQKTFAEMPEEQKNTISHRFHATVKLADWFDKHPEEF
ncbi:MAG: RdgB/HAM1 family non-canonical purine NTP pyrophosphatase [Bacteroidales bacterium]